MKRFWYVLAIYWILPALISFSVPERKWLVTNESRLEISGSSNVNEFQCLNLAYDGKDTLYEKLSTARNAYLLNGVIRLQAEHFDCQNKLITQDFRKTLNAREHPEIKVRFLGLKINKGATEWTPVNGQVEISIAGQSRSYAISCQFLNSAKNKAQLKGSKVVSLADFGLEPRPKMLGIIKVDERVQVDFHLVIQYL